MIVPDRPNTSYHNHGHILTHRIIFVDNICTYYERDECLTFCLIYQHPYFFRPHTFAGRMLRAENTGVNLIARYPP